MKTNSRAGCLSVLAAVALLAACSAVPVQPPPPSVAPWQQNAPPQGQALPMPPDRGSTAEVRQRLGEPHRRSSFAQGHEVWHYHFPAEGPALRSRLPGAELSTSERGRRATEFVLLFDAQGQLVQRLIREVP